MISTLPNRLRRYSKKTIIDAVDPDFADAVVEAANLIDHMDNSLSTDRIAGPAVKLIRNGFWYSSSFVCSECEGEVDARYSYCPNCGAKMERVEESNG